MAAEVLASTRVGETLIEAVRGDMTEERADAIVNAANSMLAHGGGLAGAIVRKGGQIIQEESNKLAPVPVGSAAATTAGNLPARWVIHAVGPRWGEGDEEKKLRSAFKSALEKALELGAASVSLPAISTGIFGYPKAEGVKVAVSETVEFVKNNPGRLKRIRFVALDKATADLFAKEVATLSKGALDES